MPDEDIEETSVPKGLGETPDLLMYINRTGAGVTAAIAATAGLVRYRIPFNAEIIQIAATVNTAPTGASLIVDVNKNGTTLFTTQASRPTIAASAFVSSTTAPDVTTVAAGDYITVDVDQVGSTVAGSDLSVCIWLQKR